MVNTKLNESYTQAQLQPLSLSGDGADSSLSRLRVTRSAGAGVMGRENSTQDFQVVILSLSSFPSHPARH